MASKKKSKKKPRPAPAETPSEGAAHEVEDASAAPRDAPPAGRPRRALAPLPPLPPPSEQTPPPRDLAFIDNPIAIALVMCLALAVMVGLTWKGQGGARGGPLTAVPKGSFLVARVDVPALRASPLFSALLGGPDASQQLGLEELARGCGFDPLSRVKELVVALPEGESRGTFGVAAQVTVSESELGTCAQRIAEARGGKTAPKTLGSFHVLEAQKGSHPGLAFREGGLLLVAEGAWLASMIEAADGPAQAAPGGELHAQLAGAITSAPRLESPALLVTAVLPRALRERLRGELDQEIAQAAGGDARDTPQAIMTAVLSVAGAGLGVALGGDGQVTARAELSCEDAASVGVLSRLLERKRFALSKELWVRFIGLGAAVDSVTIEPRETTLAVGLRASADDLGRGVARLLEVGQKRLKAAAPDAAAPGAAGAAAPSGRGPDEVVAPRAAPSQIRHPPP